MKFFLSLVRGVLTTIGIVLIVLGVGIVFVKPQLENAVRRSIQAEMSKGFGVPVTIDKVRVSFLRRAMHAEGVEVANPSLFRDEPAFVCEEVFVKVDPVTLLAGPPVLHEVSVAGATMNYRYKAGTGTNIGLLTEALESYANKHPAARQYKVELLQTTDAKVVFSTNLIPLAKVGMRVVNVRRENLDENDPLSSIQITRVFLLSVIKEAVTLKGITDPIVDELKELFD